MADGELSDESYDEILPEARIFESRIDDIWNTKMEAYEELFNKEKEEVESESDGDAVEELIQKAVECRRNKKNQSTKKGKKMLITGKENPTPSKLGRKSPRKKFLEDVLEDTPKPNKDTASAEDALLPASARKRLKKLQFETEREKRRIDAETQQILYSCDAIQNEDDDVQLIDDALIEQDIVLRIRYLSKISKMTVKLGETFKSIFEKVADSFKLKPTEILLCHDDRNIEYSETPIGLNLKFFDIIDCIPYKTEEQKKEDNSNKLLLKIQSNDSRKKIELYIHKLEKFDEIMKKYADLRKLSVKNLEFEFDGEKIEGTETPLDLDMESGSCIDVKVLNYKGSISKHPKVKPNIESKIAKEDMLDICVLD